jgi:putative spermidine/putrescine transport system substrate-binding protein
VKTTYYTKKRRATSVRHQLALSGSRAGKSAAAAVISAVTLASVSTNTTASDTLTFASWGGAYQEAQMEALVDPAAEKLGISINEDSHTGIAAIKTQVKSGNVFWDVVDLAQAECQRGANEGLWMELDYDLIPNADAIPEEYKTDHWVGLITYGTVLAWNKETAGSEKVPQNWAEFFDTDQFPGVCAMRNNARESLEIALMADGVHPDELYPLDVDRAYKKLEEIKGDVNWWTAGAESTQQIADGAVDYSAMWNGRVQSAIDDGAPADFLWNQSIVQIECVLVPRGTDNPEMAMRLINEMLDPESQANYANIIPYGPVNPDAYETGIIRDEVLAALPTSPENIDETFLLDADFWASEEGVGAIERWSRFTQQ